MAHIDEASPVTAKAWQALTLTTGRKPSGPRLPSFPIRPPGKSYFNYLIAEMRLQRFEYDILREAGQRDIKQACQEYFQQLVKAK